jgi:inner membrane protein
VENLTHSLVGAAIAELALPKTATPAQRRLFFLTGVVAANLPDADLLYTRISPAPLGYLLHHRGHTHTVLGLVLQAALTAAVFCLPALRRAAAPWGRPLAALVGAALASHLVLDSWNSYGVHPFWPVDSRWFYGDAIYILEPWLWLPLGIAAGMNARRRGAGIAVGLLVAGLVAVGAALRMFPVAAVATLAVCAAALLAAMRRMGPAPRSAAALATVVVYVGAMFALREVARSTMLQALPRPAGSEVLDVILNPVPANPLCWTALAVTRHAADGEYHLTRGTGAPLTASGCGPGRPRVAWDAPVARSLDTLRLLAARDCRVRAWLQFGRAPEIAAGSIADARFGGSSRDNFSAMSLRPAVQGAACPGNVPGWGMPRADLLGPPA